MEPAKIYELPSLSRWRRRFHGTGTAAEVNVHRAVLLCKCRLRSRLIHEEDVRPAVFVHVRNLDVVVDQVEEWQPFGSRLRESSLAIAEENDDLARAESRVDDVEISVAVKVGQRHSG